jgi:carboxyl-terminal processing protease
VIPDIEYPEIYDHDEIGESTLDDALPWDVIRPTRFRRESSIAPLLSVLENRHEARVEDDPEFSYLENLVAKNRERSERTTISLNEAERRREQAEEEAWRLALENKRRVARGEPPVDSLEALDDAVAAADEDGDAGERPQAAGDAAADPDPDASGVEAELAAAGDDTDALLEEGAQILLDYLTLSRSVAELERPADGEDDLTGN